ncbi:MAG: class IV adenylate cyclase [Candidatus Pacebacteria bacterium]|nr:class IV adenylate cyclase [Candidatus Paceibacterota bacterium]
MEIEIRTKIDNLSSFENKIKKLGFKFKKETKQTDQYFGEINLYKKIGYAFLMRVRQEKNKCFLTYKGSKLYKDGVWEEYNFEIKNHQQAVKMLEDMGLEKVISVKKKRKEYFLNNITICLDNIEKLGKFIEIELVSNKASGKKKLKDLMKKLGIKENQVIHKGYITMLLKNNKSVYCKYINH